MVGSLKLMNNPCLKCSFRLLMPDGNLWCSLVMKPTSLVFESECSFEQGSGTIYKIKPRKIEVPEKITKVKVKEAKLKPASKIKQRKTTPPQTRLF